MRYFFLLVLIVCVDLVCVDLRPLYAQGPSQKYLDMIGYEELLDLFNEYQMDPVAQERIILTYQKRAVAEGDTLKIARSYDRLARIFSPEKNIRYADSLISLTKNWDHITYPAGGYLLLAYEYLSIDDLQSSYNNLLQAYKFSEITGNIAQRIYVLDRLISLKIAWGDPDKALELQNRRHELISAPDILDKLIQYSRPNFNSEEFLEQNLLTSYEAYVLCYISMSRFNEANIYIRKHDSVLKNYSGYDKEQILHWQIDAKMEVSYFMDDFTKSIELAESSMEMNKFKKSPYYKINANLFQGLSLRSLDKFHDANRFLNIADSIFKSDRGLLSMYSSKLLYNTLVALNDDFPEKKIEYFDQLLKIDSLSLRNYKILEPQFIRTYETPRILRSKEQTIQKLQNSNKKSYRLIAFTLVIVLLSSYLAWKYYREKVVYRRRYERLMDRSSEQINKTGISGKPNKESSSVSDEVIRDIQRKLEKFEERKDYLNANINLMGLAKKFNTNSSYLSRVLNSSKSKNFSQYLNDLRIGHAVKQIKDDPVFRKYTIEAIALECGYNNSASFSRSFYKKTGLHPSYFINQVIKEKMV